MEDREKQRLRAKILEIVDYISFNLDAVTPQVVQHHLKKRYNQEIDYNTVKRELDMLVSLNMLEKDTSYKINRS